MRVTHKKTRSPKKKPSSAGLWRKLQAAGEKASTLELASAFILTGFAILLHWNFFRNAGALWRDEASCIALALQPSLGDILLRLQYDTYPILPSLIFRFLGAFGLGESDTGLRLVGLLVGLAVTGAFWLNARLFKHNIPMLGLVLTGMTVSVIRTSDAIRPYGIGILLSLICFGMIWLVASAPTRIRTLMAYCAGILMVQCLYQNIFILLSLCVSGAAVCLMRGSVRRAAVIAGIYVAAALSMAPYFSMRNEIQDWSQLYSVPVSIKTFLISAATVLQSPSGPMIFVWGLVGCVGLIRAVMLISVKDNAENECSHDGALYSLLVLVTAVAGYAAFLAWAAIYPRPWHYVSLVVIIAQCLDVITGQGGRLRLLRLGAAITVLVLFGTAAWQQTSIRQTNIDRAAAKLNADSRKQDLVLVYPWYMGVSFRRYYSGKAPWISIPPLEDLSIHRWDLVKKRMAEQNPLLDAFSRAQRTLKAGGTLWVVGILPKMGHGQQLKPIPPAPRSATGWIYFPYEHHWGLQMLLHVRNMVNDYGVVQLDTDQAVMPYEDIMIEYYRPDPPPKAVPARG